MSSMAEKGQTIFCFSCLSVDNSANLVGECSVAQGSTYTWTKCY